MKKLLIVVILLLATLKIDAQKSFNVLNPKVEQGGVMIVRVAPQWQGPWRCISFNGNNYEPNDSGEVFIGVPVETPPNKYKIYYIECGRRARVSADIEEVEIVEKQFPVIKINKRMVFVDSKKRAKETEQIRKAYSKGDKFVNYQDGYFVRPLDDIYVTDFFGKRRIYLNGETRHGGVDLRAKKDEVKSINSGVVLLAARNFSLEGNMVILDHGSGILSLYLHLSRIDVSEGSKINKGQIVGISGSTGAVTGPHLHFMVKVGGINVDPLLFIETANKYK